LETEQKNLKKPPRVKGAFINGVTVGFGIGCFATFVSLLVTAFYFSRVTSQTFGSSLSSLTFPVSYFFILGALFLTIGLVWEHFEKEFKL
jgi:predicted transporter